jgi:hypothetical protein
MSRRYPGVGLKATENLHSNILQYPPNPVQFTGSCR